MAAQPSGPEGATPDLTEAMEMLLTRVRRGLVATYGVDVGTEAAADARAWAWEHRER